LLTCRLTVVSGVCRLVFSWRAGVVRTRPPGQLAWRAELGMPAFSSLCGHEHFKFLRTNSRMARFCAASLPSVPAPASCASAARGLGQHCRYLLGPSGLLQAVCSPETPASIQVSAYRIAALTKCSRPAALEHVLARAQLSCDRWLRLASNAHRDRALPESTARQSTGSGRCQVHGQQLLACSLTSSGHRRQHSALEKR
jgi:hypothetical protein